LKCYVHPRLNAIGVCSVCGRGICKQCAVMVRGKLYCKQDIEMSIPKVQALKEVQPKAETPIVRKRGASLTVASIFAYLVGLGCMTLAFLLIIVGILGQSQQTSASIASLEPVFNYFAAISNSPGQLLVDLGLLIFILGSVDIGAGYYLWRRSKAAGIGSVVVSLLSAGLVILFLGNTSVTALVISVFLVISLIKGSALAAGRKHLR